MDNCPWCSEELTTVEHICSKQPKPSGGFDVTLSRRSLTFYGWCCPNCGRGLSPFINECPCYLLNKGMGLKQKGDPDGA